ncbi:MAG TPA: ATP-binding protein [Tepidisphaeraceae bacterium]|nr:ATP-binding protein [Tepidisphaeraceae bacterium]
MAERVRAFDWSQTALGPMATWPQNLRSAVQICLTSRFPMFIWWGSQLINIYNDAFAPSLGRRHPWALGSPAHEVWREAWPVIGPEAEGVMRTDRATWHERLPLLLYRNDVAEEAYFTWSISPLEDDQGKIGGILCVATEESARVLAERVPDHLAEQRQLALDAANMGWWHYDPITRVASFDERYKQIFGVAGHQRSNDEILKRIHPDDLPGVWARVEAALDPQNPKPYSAQYRIVLDDQSIRWIEAHGLANFKGAGSERHAITLVGTVADITDQKRAAEAMKQQADELARSNSELDRFAYVASHDLQEPMRTVHSFAQLLQRRCGESLKGDGEKYLQFIMEGVNRMRALINDLLAYSRVSTHPVAFTTVNAMDVCRVVVQTLHATIESNHASVTVDRLPMVHGDATQLGQVFQNLIANAVKFHGERNSQIRVSANETNHEWIFWVSDNGIGIAPEYFERIFIIFQRLHTIDEYSGTGIGLAICKKIVERHGGRIWVESEVGKGSTFYFSILKPK